MNKHDKLLRKVAVTIARWLKAQGGMANGYETYVEGEVRIDTNGRLKWMVPSSIKENLTHKQSYELGCEIYETIRKLLEDAGFDNDYWRGAQLRIGKEGQEHGCYKTFVLVTERHEIRID